MKFHRTLCSVIFICLCLHDVVRRTLSSSPQNLTVGVLRRRNGHSPWTDRAMLEDALKQLTVNNSTNKTTNFNLKYLNEMNLTSVEECFRFLCGELSSSKLIALVTTYDNDDSQVVAHWSQLAGIHVLGASRSSVFHNQKKFPNYNYLLPSLSEEMLVLHSIMDAVSMDQFALLRGGDQDSLAMLSSFASTFITRPNHRKYVLFNLTKNRETVRAQAINFLESIRSLSIKVIVLICNENDTEQILQASLESGLLGNDSLWIGTERSIHYVDRAPGQYVPSNMIGIQLQVIPENIALRTAEIVMNISKQDNLTSTATYLCTNSSYKYFDISPTVSTPPRNNTYHILRRYQNTSDVSGARFQITTEWSSLSGLENSKELYNKYHLFSSRTQRIRIVTIEHGQYTYQVSKTFPKCILELEHCEPQDQTCEIGVPATRYNKTTNGTYKSERICIAGLMIQILYLFKNDLQFEYDLYIVKDGKYGGFDAKTAKWNGMIGDILAGDADMALATLTTTRERSKFVDFSYPYGEVGIGLLTAASADGIQPEINMDFIHPFTLWLWTVILSSIAIVWTLIWVLDKISFTWYLKNRYARVFKKRIYFLESMSFVWSTFVHIPAGSGLPRSESSRFVSLFFALAMVIVSASYTAELAARKVKQEVTAPITGIFDEKMLNPPPGFKYGTLRDSSTEAFFKHSEDPRLRQIYHNMKENNVLRVEDGVQKLVTGEFQVYIDDRPYLEHLVSSRLNCSLRVVGDSLGTSGYAVALKKNSEWTKPLSLAILRYNENNVMQDLWEKWLKRKCISKDEFGKEPTGLAIKDLNGLFMAVLIGIGLGILSLVIENGIDYLREKRPTAVAISESSRLRNRDADAVAMDTSTSGVRLVSHFSNLGFEDIRARSDSGGIARPGESRN